MNDVLNFLSKNTIQYFATIGLDGKPKVRPFQFMMEVDGKLYFATANNKNVFKELLNNPSVAMCSLSKDFRVLRISADVEFVDDVDFKKDFVEKHPFVKKTYQSGDNPLFEMFFLKNVEAFISDLKGNIKKYQF